MTATEPSLLNSTSTFGPVNLHEIAKKHVVIVPVDVIKRLGWTGDERFTVEIGDGGALIYRRVQN